MGYVLPGGRGGGVWWVAAAAAVAFAAGHGSLLAALGPARAAPPVSRFQAAPRARPAARAARLEIAYRDADGVWRRRTAVVAPAWAQASLARWRRALPGFEVRLDGSFVRVTEGAGAGGGAGADAMPYFVGVAGGRVGVWAGRPRGYRVLVATTPLLAGALGRADLARLERGLRVASVARAWAVIARLGS